MQPPDRYRDLIDYLSFAGARFDVGVAAPRHHWPAALEALHHDASREAPAIDAEALVVKSLPGQAYLLVVVPAGRVPEERELRSALGAFQWIGAEETLEVTDGLAPGTLPPFGWPYLPGISKVFLDRQIAAADAVVFKAAAHDRTLCMTGRDFQGVLGAFELLG